MASKGRKRSSDNTEDTGTAKRSRSGKLGARGGPANLAGSIDAQDGKSLPGGGMVGEDGQEFWEVRRAPSCD